MENLDLIRKAAWSFHRTTGIEWEELFGEASLAYLEAEQKQNSKMWANAKAKKTTWLSAAVRNHLTFFCRDEGRRNNVRAPSLSPEPSPFHNLAFKELFDGSEELRTVYKMIIEAPESFAGMPPKLARGEVYRELRKMGWTWARIWDCFRKVKAVLNETA